MFKRIQFISWDDIESLERSNAEVHRDRALLHVALICALFALALYTALRSILGGDYRFVANDPELDLCAIAAYTDIAAAFIYGCFINERADVADCENKAMCAKLIAQRERDLEAELRRRENCS